MKSLVPWLVALVFLGVSAFMFSTNQKLAAEAAALRAESAQLPALRAEMEQLKTTGSPAQAEEIAQLKKNTAELLKLRNENRQLRDSGKELEKQAQSAQAREQAAQAQAEAARGQVASISTNIQALTAQVLAEQRNALATRSGLSEATLVQNQNRCINQLRQIDGAMQQWALEHRKPGTAVPQLEEVAAYLKDGFPKCPAGGTYGLGAVNTVPTCSVPGHAISPAQ